MFSLLVTLIQTARAYDLLRFPEATCIRFRGERIALRLIRKVCDPETGPPVCLADFLFDTASSHMEAAE